MGETEFRSAERGESFVDPVTGMPSADLARRNLFASDDGDPNIMTANANRPTGDDRHNLSFFFDETLGALNSSYIPTAAYVAPTATLPGTFVPMGSLTWNNRPYANEAELANVPFLSSEALTYCFNSGSQSTVALSPDMATEYELMAYFGRNDTGDDFRHLLRTGQDNGITTGIAGAMLRLVLRFPRRRH